MPNDTVNELRKIGARCRLAAADLAAEGFDREHDGMIQLANSLDSNGIRTAQYMGDQMVSNVGDAFGDPGEYQTQELGDVGSEEFPRPTEEEILGRKAKPGSRLDPERGPEDVFRKWVVEIRDIPAKNEEDLRQLVEPFVDEVGGLLADYKEEAPRTRQGKGGGGA